MTYVHAAHQGNPLETLYAVRGLQGVTGEITMSPDGIVRTVEEEMFTFQNGLPIPVQ